MTPHPGRLGLEIWVSIFVNFKSTNIKKFVI